MKKIDFKMLGIATALEELENKFIKLQRFVESDGDVAIGSDEDYLELYDEAMSDLQLIKEEVRKDVGFSN